MKKINKKILLTLLWIIIFGLMSWKEQYTNILFWGIGVIITLLWIIDIDSISNLSLDLKAQKIEMSTMVENTKKAAKEVEATAEEVEVTANTFVKAVNSFMNFTLADIQKQGRFMMAIPWKDAANFINESIELKKVLNDTDPETGYLVLRAKCKVVELFESEAHDIFLLEREELAKYISSGITLGVGELEFNYNNVAIDFDGLKELVLQVPEGKKVLWKKEIDELKKFYDNHFK